MSYNRIAIIAVVAGYLLVNITMQVAFFSGEDIFTKYQVAASPDEALDIAQNAYYAKTAFLLMLLALLALKVPFGLGFGLSFFAYASIMLAFFGLHTITAIYLAASIVLIGSYFLRNRGIGNVYVATDTEPTLST